MARVRSLAIPGVFGGMLLGRTPCARESCDYSQQSRAFGCWFGGGALGEARVRSLAIPVLVGRAGRRTPCARERAVIAHSSPEPSAAGSEGACWESASAEPRVPGLVGRAGRRTPCARKSCDCSQQSRAFGWLVRRGASSENAELGLSASRGSAGEREYRASRARACWEGWQAHSVR